MAMVMVLTMKKRMLMMMTMTTPEKMVGWLVPCRAGQLR